MVIEHHVKGYENFTKLVESLENSGTIHVLFSGGKEENGESWCPYCTKGNIILKKIKSLQFNNFWKFIKICMCH